MCGRRPEARHGRLPPFFFPYVSTCALSSTSSHSCALFLCTAQPLENSRHMLMWKPRETVGHGSWYERDSLSDLFRPLCAWRTGSGSEGTSRIPAAFRALPSDSIRGVRAFLPQRNRCIVAIAGPSWPQNARWPVIPFACTALMLQRRSARLHLQLRSLHRPCRGPPRPASRARRRDTRPSQ